jgi:hypothetical protein
MKRTMFILGMFAMSMTSNAQAQIQVQESPKDSTIWKDESRLPMLKNFYTKDYNSYTLYYKNAKYSTINDIDYISIGDKPTAIQFFEILKKVADGGEKVTFDLDDNTWVIDKGARSGMVLCWSSLSYFYMTSDQLTKVLETLNK